MKGPTSSLPTDSKSVVIQPNLLRKQIAITEKSWEQARVFFRGRDVVELSYEDLVDEPESCMSKIFSWLGLEIVPVSSWTNKQNPESLSDLVENYSDILPILEEKGFE